MKRSNRPRQLRNLPSSTKINWAKYKSKYYLHFDERINIEHVKDKIQNREWVAKHAFFPSIHFKIIFNKYVTISKDKSLPINQQKEKRVKVREIYYSAHKDRFIYKYYGDLLNQAYNEYARKNGIDDIALAYRNNKPGKNNVDFAYEVFDFLFHQNQAIVISIDFTKFFDHIDHKTLKQNLQTVLAVEELPIDWYKVYKNLTQFTYVNKADIDAFIKKQYGVKKLKVLLKEKKLKRIMSSAEFREFKKCHLYKNKKPYGIPQGSGMSAVCSNVHLIHFDQDINDWAQAHHALYRRYCDDLILVIPVADANPEILENLKNEVIQIILNYQSLGLKIQQEKTELRIYSNGTILNESQQKSKLDYLGFVTNGITMHIREKSLFKYYSRAYRKADTSRRIKLATKRKGPRKELFKIYTHLGFNYKDRGNFITYAYRAHGKMVKLKTKSLIKKQVKRHWNKIHKRL
ncbi:reverse transcriptase domain-containing protein [Heyndrickxia sporothermodurans]|uniref:reverse transcriptase domain-containing protein n=1 Tax=Heyndrickxia sporothermodurans TaxID=46224 RepID=UPI002DB8349E|nr:reverse transcriptase domain-containing protein [Heyndrickxia sporothermodurans]MEB6549637.1 reverse transcriptase domain-containing protein [Heyndrickxia sporothermodurans]